MPGFASGTLKLVLVCIAQHTNGKKGDHSCFPSVERLAEMTGLSQGSVSKAVDALDAVGAFKNYIRGGGRLKSTYVLDMERIRSSRYSQVTSNSLEISSEDEPCPTPDEPCPSPDELSTTSGVPQGSFGKVAEDKNRLQHCEKDRLLRAEPGSLPGSHPRF